MKKFIELYETDETLPYSITYTFKNGVLVKHEHELNHFDNDVFTDEMTNEFLERLKEMNIIHFPTDVPNLMVEVPIDVIDDSGILFIETYHYNLDDMNEWLHERNINGTRPFHEFLGLEEPIIVEVD